MKEGCSGIQHLPLTVGRGLTLITAALQIELHEDIDILQFLKEYNLTEKPLQMDILVLKIESDRVVNKSIGRIFRRHNIIEYKSPDDYVSINDFYKAFGYAYIYQSGTQKVNEISTNELTITFACYHYPQKMIRLLKMDHNIVIEQKGIGIYYIKNLMLPVQIVLLNKLSPSEYIWLSRLRSGLDVASDIEPLAEEYRGKEFMKAIE